jgi:predicted nucleic acid-binding protein
MSQALCFVDTNVLLYGIDDKDPQKHKTALTLIEQLSRAKTGIISTQILLEYAANLTQKFKVSRKTAALMTAAFAEWQVMEADVGAVLRALARSTENNVSIWDAMVIEAALRSGAQTLYTEDLQHGQRFGDLTIINPFIAQ